MCYKHIHHPDTTPITIRPALALNAGIGHKLCSAESQFTGRLGRVSLNNAGYMQGKHQFPVCVQLTDVGQNQ